MVLRNIETLRKRNELNVVSPINKIFNVGDGGIILTDDLFSLTLPFKFMEIQKIFSDQYDEERLYSVLMTEEELAFFSEAVEEASKPKKSVAKKVAAGAGITAGVAAGTAVGVKKGADVIRDKAIKELQKMPKVTFGDEKAKKLQERAMKADHISKAIEKAPQKVVKSVRNAADKIVRKVVRK